MTLDRRTRRMFDEAFNYCLEKEVGCVLVFLNSKSAKWHCRQFCILKDVERVGQLCASVYDLTVDFMSCESFKFDSTDLCLRGDSRECFIDPSVIERKYRRELELLRRFDCDDRTMTFGKFKGKRFDEVPIDYWKWIVEKTNMAETRPEVFQYAIDVVGGVSLDDVEPDVSIERRDRHIKAEELEN